MKMRNAIILFLIPAFAEALAADGYATPYGEWRGQTQYQAKIRAESDAAAHAVIPLILNIEPGGKVTGGSPDNGCRVLGIAKPGIAPNIVTLNVTLTGCAYAGFNRTYIGHIALYTEKKFAALSLQAISMTGKGGSFTIESTMRR